MRMSKRAATLLALCATATVTACGTPPAPSPARVEPLIHFANRSNTALAVAPNLLIPACGSASVAVAAYETSRTLGAKGLMDGTWAVPPGAEFWNGVGFAGDTITDDLTVVISGTAPPGVRRGVPNDADLPACGGAPVGVLDEVVPGADPADGAAPEATIAP
jgi:hypothetical protein